MPDVLTLQSAQTTPRGPIESSGPGGIAVATAPPRAKFVVTAVNDVYLARANRVAIRHVLGNVVAMVEIVSPGNKASRAAFRSFVEKSVPFVQRGIHLLIVDLFPPTPRDPQGIHKAIWDEIEDAPFAPPLDKPLTIVSYFAGAPKTAYIEPAAVGDPLPDMAILLDDGEHIPAPLEESYETTWRACPQPRKDAVTNA